MQVQKQVKKQVQNLTATMTCNGGHGIPFVNLPRGNPFHDIRMSTRVSITVVLQYLEE